MLDSQYNPTTCNPGHYHHPHPNSGGWALLPIPLLQCDNHTIWHYRHPLPKYSINYEICISVSGFLKNGIVFPRNGVEKQKHVPLSRASIVYAAFSPLRCAGVNSPLNVFSSVNSRECGHRSTAGHLILTSHWPW